MRYKIKRENLDFTDFNNNNNKTFGRLKNPGKQSRQQWRKVNRDRKTNQQIVVREKEKGNDKRDRQRKNDRETEKGKDRETKIQKD